MSALTAAIVQTGAASVVAGVALAFLAYVTGADRFVLRVLYVVGYVVRHPLWAAELMIAIPLSWLPAPRPRAVGVFHP